MQLHVYARPSLIDPPLAPAAAAVLLEGAWPDGTRPVARWSLDEAIDGRFAALDLVAAEYAEAASTVKAEAADTDLEAIASPYYLSALDLRYYLVKLLRVVAFFQEECPLRAGDQVHLTLQRGDEAYALLLKQLCNKAGAALREHRSEATPGAPRPAAANGLIRRSIGRFLASSGHSSGIDSGPRAVFCGSPRILEAVSDEWLSRGGNAWWLYDRFAFRAWWRGWPAGIGQLVCNSSCAAAAASDPAPRTPAPLPHMAYHGIEFDAALGLWAQQHRALFGAARTRLVNQIDRHFAAVQPAALILDEDATPLARATVALARRRGISSVVVQHGAPCCRFGFTPLAADRICVWGESTRDELRRWGVDDSKLQVTGSPAHRPAAGRPARPAGRFEILLLATVPPRDSRPDAISLNLTRRSYENLVRLAATTVLADPHTRLWLRPHPRSGSDPILRAIFEASTAEQVRWAAAGSLEAYFRRVNCVLSCGSTGGIDAALFGLPVLHLVPPGAVDFLTRQPWGFSGVASTPDQLRQGLAEIRQGRIVCPDTSSVFAAVGDAAAARVVDVVLALVSRANSDPTGQLSLRAA